jgi:hypothetical protein
MVQVLAGKPGKLSSSFSTPKIQILTCPVFREGAVIQNCTLHNCTLYTLPEVGNVHRHIRTRIIVGKYYSTFPPYFGKPVAFLNRLSSSQRAKFLSTFY